MNEHDAWRSLIGKYEISDKKQESLNDVTNRCKNCKIKDASLYLYIWFNELYNLNLKLNKIKEKYERDEDKLKAHFSYVLT